MTKFQDGPAAGKTLAIRRSPLFLRVVDDNGTFDALDQLDDRPNITEKVYVYVLVRNDGMIHLNMRNAQGRPCGGYFAMAEYRLFEQQPEDATVRSRRGWPEWCEARAAAPKDVTP